MSLSMKWLLGLLATGLLACATEETDPRELFLEAARAAEAAPQVRYRFVATVSGPEAERRLEGTALIERLDMSGSNFRARLEATEDLGANETPARLSAVRQRDDVYLLDEASRIAQHGSLYAGGSSLLYRLDPVLMYAFYDPRAIASEAEAMEVLGEGDGAVRGEPCRLVRAAYADDEEDSRWCLGTNDSLPRLMEWIGPETTTTLEIFEIEVLAEVSDRDFAVDLPADWTLDEKSVGQPVGSPAAAWSLPTTTGQTLSLDDLHGQVVVLDFWATWCPPCLTTLDNLQDLQASYNDQPVHLIAVNTMESGDPISFLRQRGYDFTALLDGDDLHDRVAPGSLPAFAVIDAQGRWAGAGVGYYGEGSERYLRQLIDQALDAAR